MPHVRDMQSPALLFPVLAHLQGLLQYSGVNAPWLHPSPATGRESLVTV